MTAVAPFNINDACVVADIVRACQQMQRVVWLDSLTNELTYGTVRNICLDDTGAFISDKVDVRSGWLRITTVGGWEQFFPMLQVMFMVHKGVMVFNPSKA